MRQFSKKDIISKSTPKKGQRGKFSSNSEDLDIFIKFCCWDRTGMLGHRRGLKNLHVPFVYILFYQYLEEILAKDIGNT